MPMSIVKVAAGGLPVTIATSGGLPCTEATNGFGIAVTQSTTGRGLGVTGFTFGPDVTAPIITSSNTISNVENTVLAHTLTANEPVTWAIVAGGVDNARFELSGNTLRWLSNGVKDFEAPNDANVDNAYIVTVRATDLASNPSTTQTITVTVLNAVAAAAPTLTLLTDASDNTPDFSLLGDLVLNDTVRFQYSTSAVFSGASELTNTIDAAEDAANTISFTTGALASGTWYFRARIERPDAPVSGWSNTETITFAVTGVVWTKTANPATQSGGLSSYTFTSTALGAAGSRITVIGCDTFTSIATNVTVGGLAATKAAQEAAAISSVQMWYVDTTSLGTSANIVVSAGVDPMHDVTIVVGQIVGATATPTTTALRSATAADPVTVTATVPSGGVGLALFFSESATSGVWSNATQDYNTTTGIGSLTLANTTTAGSQTPTYTGTGGTQVHGLMVCWGP